MLSLLPLVMFGTVPGTEGWNTCQGQLATDVLWCFWFFELIWNGQATGHTKSSKQSCKATENPPRMHIPELWVHAGTRTARRPHRFKALKNHGSTTQTKVGFSYRMVQHCSTPWSLESLRSYEAEHGYTAPHRLNTVYIYIYTLFSRLVKHSYSPMTCFRCFGETLLKSFESQRLTYLT